MSEKRCFKCGEVKSLSAFYCHKAMADGHLNKCKDCTRSDVQKHRRGNDHVRERDRARGKRPDRVAHNAANTSRWRSDNPEKYQAHTAVNNAIRDGKLKKSGCEVCGVEEVHAHHDDYSKPLAVRWLCAKHHHRLHAERASG